MVTHKVMHNVMHKAMKVMHKVIMPQSDAQRNAKKGCNRATMHEVRVDVLMTAALGMRCLVYNRPHQFVIVSLLSVCGVTAAARQRSIAIDDSPSALTLFGIRMLNQIHHSKIK
jgi:hypothetical protein